MRKFCSLLLIITGLYADQPAPNPRLTGSPLLRTWRAEDYEASPVNWRVAHHPANGFIYATNNAGLLEFDGARWRLHPMPRGGAARGLVIDAAGRVWVGGIGEIARFEPQPGGRLFVVDLTDQVAAGATGADTPADDADDTAAAASGPAPLRGLGNLNRVAATTAGVFFRLPDTIAHFPAAGGPARLLPAKGRFGQLFPVGDDLVIENLELGLQRLEGETLVPLPRATATRAFAARRDAAGTLWVLTPQGPQRWARDAAAPDPVPAETAALFQEQEPTCALFLADGRFVYGTTRSGVFVFDHAGRFERRIDRTHGLPANRVNGLAEDGEGGLWLAQHTGLVRMQLDSPFAVHGLAQGLSGSPRHVLRAGSRLYVTHGEGLSWRDDQDGRFNAVAGFRTGSHRSILAPDGTVFVSAQGLHSIAPDGDVRLSPGGYLYDLHLWRRHPGWLLASSAFALRFFRADDSGGWRDDGALRSVAAGVDDMLETGDGYLWLVTRTGEVWRVDFRDGPRPDAPAVRYDVARGVPPALRRDHLRLLRLESELFVAGPRNLLRYDSAADHFSPDARFPTDAQPGSWSPAVPPGAADGDTWFYFPEPRPRLAHLFADAAGRWRSQDLSAAELSDLVINHLAADPGQRTLWLAGQGALVSVDLDWRPAHPSPPLHVVLRGATTPDGRAVAIDRSIPLPTQVSSLRFEFAAPAFAADYRGRAGMAFRTRLDGLDRDWTGWTLEPHRDFTNLPAGRFTLRVQSRDFRGRVSEEATLGFAITPPWWREPGVLAAGLLLVFAGVAGLVRLGSRAQRLRAQRLEELVTARTRELTASNSELARLHQLDLDEKTAAHLATEKAQLEMLRYQLNPHFLFNALNSVYGFVYPHSREAGDLVRHLADFCRQTLTRRSDDWHTLEDEFAMLRTYLDIEQLRWRERLHVTVELDPAVRMARLPAFLLLPLLENAIKHGGATSSDRLDIQLRAQPAGDSLRITVTNTGRWLGRDEPRLQPSAHIGLENLRARLQRSFPGTHTFTTSAADGGVVVTLSLPVAGQSAV